MSTEQTTIELINIGVRENMYICKWYTYVYSVGIRAHVFSELIC